MMRDSIIIAADRRGEFSRKPRPFLVVSSNSFPELQTIVVLPITARADDSVAFLRISVPASEQTGLVEASWIEIELITAIRKSRVVKTIGEADDATLLAVRRALAVFLSIA